jgi:hypothetical protein
MSSRHKSNRPRAPRSRIPGPPQPAGAKLAKMAENKRIGKSRYS